MSGETMRSVKYRLLKVEELIGIWEVMHEEHPTGTTLELLNRYNRERDELQYYIDNNF